MEKLTEEQQERYQRNLWVEDFTPHMQEKLFDSRIMVVGAGGLGSVVLQYCAAAGIGHIDVVDFDEVSLSNLQRQILYVTSDLGAPKADRAARRLQRINPAVRAVAHRVKITSENACEMMKGCNLVVDCTDNYEARYILDAACRQLQIPLVYGTAEQRGGQVSVFHFQGAAGYSDLYPVPVAGKKGRIGVLSPLPGIIGSLEAMEVIKLLTGWGEPLAGRLLVLDARDMSASVFEL